MEIERIVHLFLHFWNQIWSSKLIFSTKLNDSDQSQLLLQLKTRYNYASGDCAARIISSNPGASHPVAILSSSKDTSLRNLCSAPVKFVTIELCQEIKPETLVLANYELFSSTVNKFRVFGSKSLEVPIKDWLLLGQFEAKPNHLDQIFSFATTRIQGSFVKYLRINFDSHHGNEHFCPISSVRVYGKTMLDEFNEDLESNTDNLPVLSEAFEEQKLANLASELHEVRQQIEQLEVLQSSMQNCTQNSLIEPSQCFEHENTLAQLKSRAVLLESETMTLSEQLSRRRPGNIYRDLSSRLRKLESLLPISLGNLQFLAPTHRLEQSRPLITALPPFESHLFDLKQLQAQLNAQQFWINTLLMANSLLFLSVLTCLLALFRRQPTNKPLELRRLPLSSLKSPSMSSTSSQASHSSLPSLNNPGVVLSDDEFMMGDSGIHSNGSILFTRRSVDKMAQ